MGWWSSCVFSVFNAANYETGGVQLRMHIFEYAIRSTMGDAERAHYGERPLNVSVIVGAVGGRDDCV